MYYHNFTIGFNWWMVTAVLFIIIGMFLGYFQVDYAPMEKKLYRRYNDNVFLLLGIIVSAVMMVLLFVESTWGIVQFLDNHLSGNDDPIWSFLLTPFIVLGTSGVFGVMVYSISKAISYIHVRHLKKVYRIQLRSHRRKKPRH